MNHAHTDDPRELPVPYRPKASHPDIEHFQKEWNSGSRGDGYVPPAFEWTTNPKQYQEERGAGNAERVLSK